MAEDLADLRQRLKAQLPGRIDRAVAGYEDFTGQDAPTDARGFAAWHAAAKAALAHVELLVKLARWAERKPEAPAARESDCVEGLLAQARAALDALDGEDDREEGEDSE